MLTRYILLAMIARSDIQSLIQIGKPYLEIFARNVELNFLDIFRYLKIMEKVSVRHRKGQLVSKDAHTGCVN